MRVKIYGAGSMGNHLGQASRRAGWDVTIVDKNPDMLRVLKEEVYPARYGAWDSEIKLCTLENEPRGGFDIIMIGTPPDTHVNLAINALKEEPKVLQIEKPLFTPNFEGVKEFLEELKKHPNVKVINGYEYSLSKFAGRTKDILEDGVIGDCQLMDVEIRERWDGILNAHPWIRGLEHTYLGFWRRGGGTTSEHSHGINLFGYFAEFMNWGRITEVSATVRKVSNMSLDYDESSLMNFRTEKGGIGRVQQDVVTHPARCWMRIQGSNGFLECNKSHREDSIIYQKNGEEEKTELFDKARPDDFYQEILHIKDIIDGKVDIKDSPVSLEKGLETQLVIAAVHKSAQEKRTVKIDYSKGYCLEALI